MTPLHLSVIAFVSFLTLRYLIRLFLKKLGPISFNKLMGDVLRDN